MTTTTDGCACHGDLGIEPTAVPDDVLEQLKGVSTPTISLVLRRLGYRLRDHQGGDVLVIDARGDTRARVTGDILATRLKYRGAAALVADGAIGDLEAMQAVGLPLYSRRTTPVSFGELHVMADLNVPIACAEVLIMPADILVGDPEGVMAIPQAVAAEMAEEGLEIERRDAFSREKVEAGRPLAEGYPLNAALRAEYEAARKRSSKEA